MKQIFLVFLLFGPLARAQDSALVQFSPDLNGSFTYVGSIDDSRGGGPLSCPSSLFVQSKQDVLKIKGLGQHYIMADSPDGALEVDSKNTCQAQSCKISERGFHRVSQAWDSDYMNEWQEKESLELKDGGVLFYTYTIWKPKSNFSPYSSGLNPGSVLACTYKKSST